MKNLHPPSKPPRVQAPVVWALIFALIFEPLSGAMLLAQDKCETALANARRSYANGRYDQAIATLQPCLQSNRLPAVEQVGGFRLVALCYLSKDNRVSASNTVKQLLNFKRDYQPDAAQDPKAYVDLVKKTRKELEPVWAQQAASDKQKERELQQERERLEAEEQQRKLAEKQEADKKKNEQEELERQREKTEQQEEQIKANGNGPGKKWLWIALAGVAVGAGTGVALAIGGGNDDKEKELPSMPPDRPPRP